MTSETMINETLSKDTMPNEFKLAILKICLFSTFFVLGLIGNSLVLIGIGLNKGMQTPTNLLIFNLALADILFIIVCIPTTLCGFFGLWPFAEIGCKLAQFINHLSAFMSIYLLVFMSIDRYLAIVHAIDSISNYRTTKNTTISIIALWLIGICLSLIIGSLFTVIKYESDQSTVSMYCMLRYLRMDVDTSASPQMITSADSVEFNGTSTSTIHLNQTLEIRRHDSKNTLPIAASLYWLGFVIFLYALPLTVIVVLYGLMLKFLRGTRGQSVGKSKRRATRMILAVILTYALCWFLMQLLFISNVVLSRNTGHDFATYMDILTMFANVFAYLNSCTNPILYGFMSKNFRSSFIDLLCCRYSKRSLCTGNDSLHHRRAMNNKFHLNASFKQQDYSMGASFASRYSQLPPLLSPTNNASSALTTECLDSTFEPQNVVNEEENHSSLENSRSSQSINVATQTGETKKTYRKRKHEEKPNIVSYSPLTLKNKEMLCV